MNTKLGIGILSFAHGHANVYCQVLKDFPDSALIAAWDDNAERGGAACERFGIPLYATPVHDYGDLVSTNVPRPANAIPLQLLRKGDTAWTAFPISLPQSHAERLAAIPRPFVDYVLGRTDQTVTVEDGRVAVEMVLAAYQSAKEGRRIEL